MNNEDFDDSRDNDLFDYSDKDSQEEPQEQEDEPMNADTNYYAEGQESIPDIRQVDPSRDQLGEIQEEELPERQPEEQKHPYGLEDPESPIEEEQEVVVRQQPNFDGNFYAQEVEPSEEI